MSFKLGKAVTSERVFVTTHSGLSGRWDPNYYRHMTRFRARVKSCPFPVEPLVRHLTQVQYGISERATSEPIGTPMLRMVNLQDDAWDLAELKYTQMPSEELEPYLLHEGDILFNRTNSKELIGKCQVFDLPGRFVFASYLIRVRTNEAKLLPDYVTAYLSLPVGRMLIDAVSRQIAGMTNINAEEIRELLVPRPDLATQRRIVAAWKKALGQREKTEAQARQLLASIDDLLLSELGIQLPPEPPATLENRVFTRPFSTLTGERWDPLFFHRDIYDFIRHPKLKLKPLREFVGRMTTGFAAGKDDQADDDTGVVQIRPTNMSDDRDLVFTRNIYIARSELAEHPLDVLGRGEVLFNNTNSQELVGKTVFFDLPGEFFASNHITRVTPRKSELHPEFLTHILNLYQRKRVFFRLCTNWNNQSGVGPDVLGKVLIPEIPITTQQRIAEKIAARRDEAKRLRAAAAAQLAAAKLEIEAMILG